MDIINENLIHTEIVRCPYCHKVIEAPNKADIIFSCPNCKKELITYDKTKTALKHHLQNDVEVGDDYCKECGQKIPRTSIYCPYCGCLHYSMDIKSDNHWGYFFFSFFVPIIGIILIFNSKKGEIKRRSAIRGTCLGLIVGSLICIIL